MRSGRRAAPSTPPARDRVLVVNADDFGLTPGVCEGILRAHRDGIVTSTSALAVAPAFGRYAGALRDAGTPTGVHLAVVGEDPPLLGPREVPTLFDRRGTIAADWRSFVRRAARGAIDPADLERELSAQIEAVTAAGLRPVHLDSHQHLHLWPSFGSVLVRLAQRHGIPAVRLTGSTRFDPVSLGVRFLRRRAAARARRAGLVVPDHSAGLDGAGHLDEATLRGVIERLGRAGGHADLTTHPGEDPDPERARYRWGYAWSTELEALCAEGMREHVARCGFRLGSYRDLAGARSGVPGGSRAPGGPAA